MRAPIRISGGTELTVRAAPMWSAFVLSGAYPRERTNAGGKTISWSRPLGSLKRSASG
jgi:hypothetical protein